MESNLKPTSKCNPQSALMPTPNVGDKTQTTQTVRLIYESSTDEENFD